MVSALGDVYRMQEFWTASLHPRNQDLAQAGADRKHLPMTWPARMRKRDPATGPT